MPVFNRSDEPRQTLRPCCTLLMLAMSFASGILLRQWDSNIITTGVAGTFIVMTAAVPSWRPFAVICGLWICAGFVRSLPQTAEDGVTPKLCAVNGRVVERRIVRVSPFETRSGVAADYTRAVLEVTASTAPALTGRTIDLFVDGHATELVSGAHVHCTAKLERRPQPANPGERWRGKAGEPYLRVNHPDAVSVTRPLGVRQWRNEIRAGLSATLQSRLPQNLSAVAETLILGERERLSDKTADAFRETGTGHLLAISGLHLGVIAWLLTVISRQITVSLRWQTAIVCVLVILYALLVEPRASIVRATVFAVLGGFAILQGRAIASVPLWAAALIIVLAIDPAQLFEPGAQLSFAAVLAIIAIIRFDVVARLTPAWFAYDEMTPHAWLRKSLSPVWVLAVWGVLLWLATAPLAAYHFRSITAWGALLHVACFPLVVVAMASTLLALMVDLWLPIAGSIWMMARWSLAGLVGTVQWATEHNWFSAEVGEPSPLFLIGLYGSLLALIAAQNVQTRKWIRAGLAGWIAASAAVAYWPSALSTLRVTTLSVGHGLCVLIQTPSGHTALYDAGSLGNTDRVARDVSDAMRALNVSKVDTLILSHTDHDHFSLARSIAQEFSISEVWCHHTFLESDSMSVKALAEYLNSREIPIHTRARRDEVLWGDVRINVLHPGADDNFEVDNEDSLVVAMQFAGRRILFTGDVEGAGQQRLFATPTEQFDVLMSPHHGARASNTSELENWANPQIVISSGARSAQDHLQAVYASSAIYETCNDGAVTVEIDPLGQIHMTTFRPRPTLESRRPTGI